MNFIEHTGSFFDDSAPGEEDLINYFKFIRTERKMAWRQNSGRLGDVTEAGRPVLQGLEVILQILRLGGHFSGDHAASAPPPSCDVCFSRSSSQASGETVGL